MIIKGLVRAASVLCSANTADLVCVRRVPGVHLIGGVKMRIIEVDCQIMMNNLLLRYKLDHYFRFQYDEAEIQTSWNFADIGLATAAAQLLKSNTVVEDPA